MNRHTIYNTLAMNLLEGPWGMIPLLLACLLLGVYCIWGAVETAKTGLPLENSRSQNLRQLFWGSIIIGATFPCLNDGSLSSMYQVGDMSLLEGLFRWIVAKSAS